MLQLTKPSLMAEMTCSPVLFRCPLRSVSIWQKRDVSMRCCHGNMRSFIPQGNEEESPDNDVSMGLSSGQPNKHHL